MIFITLVPKNLKIAYPQNAYILRINVSRSTKLAYHRSCSLFPSHPLPRNESNLNFENILYHKFDFFSLRSDLKVAFV